MTDTATLQRILRETRKLALVGVSANPMRPSHDVWSYLRSHSDYELYLVNPTISEIDGTVAIPAWLGYPRRPTSSTCSGVTNTCRRCWPRRSKWAPRSFGYSRAYGMNRWPVMAKRRVCKS